MNTQIEAVDFSARIKRDNKPHKRATNTAHAFWKKHHKAIVLTGIAGGCLSWYIASPAHGTVGLVNLTSPTAMKVAPIAATTLALGFGDADMNVDYSYLQRNNPHAKVGRAMAMLIGVHATDKSTALPKSVKVNWTEALRHMWKLKMVHKNVTPVALQFANSMVDQYAQAPRDTKSIGKFIHQINLVANHTNKIINYPGLCRDMLVPMDNCSSLFHVMTKVDGMKLAAYGMTEIFPSHDGEYNYIALDTLLRNAGENFVQAIPALGDGLMSKGFYQFTSYAVRRDDIALGGVNRVDNHAGRGVADSVVRLNGSDNHRAAFEFAAYNMASLMRGLNKAEAERLATHCSDIGLTEFIATSHHMPVVAIHDARKWVEAGCNQPYTDYTGPHLKEYANKTAANYKALIKFQ